MADMKQTRLTIKLDNRIDLMPVKIWGMFDDYDHFWFNHREDGPAWVSQLFSIWYKYGQEISCKTSIPT